MPVDARARINASRLPTVPEGFGWTNSQPRLRIRLAEPQCLGVPTVPFEGVGPESFGLDLDRAATSRSGLCFTWNIGQALGLPLLQDPRGGVRLDRLRALRRGRPHTGLQALSVVATRLACRRACCAACPKDP
ncbi:hypothetical protein CTE05_34770 [Cellulomonas terrae]|uniref:Uncharacterized protein n=1 Tax=Cellulomonas terrae TaxID=311234 RepID=A0A511JPH4_9CELL|nr:hypothetical protein CTE05_34770 [Cellulomonas terrae]